MSKNTVHEQLIEQAITIDPSLRRGRFRSTLIRFLAADAHADGCRDEDDEPISLEECRQEATDDLARFPFIPDAFRIDKERRLITALEVVVTSRIVMQKLSAYVDLWWALDSRSWWLDIVVADHTGNAYFIDVIDLAYQPIRGIKEIVAKTEDDARFLLTSAPIGASKNYLLNYGDMQ